ncbi:UrcA family protein [Caulobacter sp.]|uniref:UrcA family protein n=1 Tax=Caulobacter sp. TaxID=78 RepID=UPI003BAD8BD4
MSKLINRLAAVAALTLAATPIIGLTAAHAAERAQPAVRIQIGDLRLSHPADAAEFNRRAEAAADQFCAARTHFERLGELSARACVMDFHDAVNAELTRAQHTELKAARRAQPTTFAAR